MRFLSFLLITLFLTLQGNAQVLGDGFLKRVAQYCKAAKRDYSLQDVAVVPGLTYYQDGREYRDYAIGIRKKIVTENDTALLLDAASLFCKHVLGTDTTVFNSITASLCTGNFKAESRVFNQPELYRSEQYRTQVFFDSVCMKHKEFKSITTFNEKGKVERLEFELRKKFLSDYLQFHVGRHLFFHNGLRLSIYIEKSGLGQMCADIVYAYDKQIKPDLARPLTAMQIDILTRKSAILDKLEYLDTVLLKQIREAPTDAKVTKIIHWAVKKPLKHNFKYLTTQLVGDSSNFSLFNSQLYFKKETTRFKRKRLFKRIRAQFNHNRIWRWQSNDIRLLYSDRLKMIITGGVSFFK